MWSEEGSQEGRCSAPGGSEEPSGSGAAVASAADGDGARPGASERAVRVYVGTWNMHAKNPPESLVPFLPDGGGEYELYAIGTQEAERSIPQSMLLPSKAKWEARLQEAFGPRYKCVGRHTLAAIHLALFAKRELLPAIAHVQSAHVATGIGNKLGNKGGVGICFQLGRTSVLLINSHLSAHQHKVKERDADFHRIDQQLPLRPPAATRGSAAEGVAEGACAHFDVVVWLGDLNYRIRGNRTAVEALCMRASAQARQAAEWRGEEAHWAAMRAVLLANDQLRRQQALGLAFVGFEEAEIQFKPTYKFDAESDTYDTSEKQRVPAYTDRILYKSRRKDAVQVLQYDACSEVRTSDHRPVFALLEVRYEVSGTASGSQRQKRHTRSASTASAICAIS